MGMAARGWPGRQAPRGCGRPGHSSHQPQFAFYVTDPSDRHGEGETICASHSAPRARSEWNSSLPPQELHVLPARRRLQYAAHAGNESKGWEWEREGCRRVGGEETGGEGECSAILLTRGLPAHRGDAYVSKLERTDQGFVSPGPYGQHFARNDRSPVVVTAPTIHQPGILMRTWSGSDCRHAPGPMHLKGKGK